MRLLMISTDRSLFSDDSAVMGRLLEQASLVTEIHVVVFTGRGEQYKKLNPGKHLHIYPTLSSGRFSYLPDAYRCAREIIEHVDHHDTWLITAQDPFECGALGYLLARKLKLPLHIQLHTDPWSEKWKHDGTMNRIRFILGKFIFHRAHGIRVVSERLEKQLLACGIPQSKITRVPIYVDVNYFHSTLPSFDLRKSYPEYSKIVLSIGRLTREKNFQALIRAFAEVRKSHCDAMLIIVGSGPLRDNLMLLARSFGIDAHVKFLPWARDVVSYYKGCDLYVQSSLYEGWGLAVVEAMASGAPVVMTDVGLAGEIVREGETGVIAEPGNIEELTFCINRVLSDNALRLGLIAEGEKEVEKLATKAETLLLYKSSWDGAHLNYAKIKKSSS